MGVVRPTLPLPSCPLVFLLAACAGATTTNRNDAIYSGAKPERILVSADIRSGPAANPSSDDPDARLLVDDVVRLLKARNVPAQAAAKQPPSGHAFVVRLTSTDIEHGNYWERMVVGLGWGQSSLSLHVDMIDSVDSKHLLSFDIAADSGNEPGLITAFVNVTGGIIIPVVAGSASAYHLDGLGPARDIDEAANATVFGLTTFFRRLGWDDWTGSSGTALGMSATSIPSPKPRQ